MEKRDYVDRACEWLISKPFDYIVVDEAYKVYEHMNKESKKDLFKKFEGFARSFNEYMENRGWKKREQVFVEYRHSAVEVARSGASTKTTAARKIVWFRDDSATSPRVASLLDQYFKEIVTPQGAQLIRNDTI
jgi:hypothetical protein